MGFVFVTIRLRHPGVVALVLQKVNPAELTGTTRDSELREFGYQLNQLLPCRFCFLETRGMKRRDNRGTDVGSIGNWATGATIPHQSHLSWFQLGCHQLVFGR